MSSLDLIRRSFDTPSRFLGTGQATLAMSPEDRQEALATASRNEAYANEGIGAKILKATAGTPLDLMDVIASSIGLTEERGDLSDGVLRGIGWDRAADWMNVNRGAVEVGSGIAGIVGTMAIAEFAIPKILHSAYMSSTALGRGFKIFDSMATIGKRNSRVAELAAAKNGEFLNALAPANRAFIAGKAGQYAAYAGVSEATIAATMNTNSFLWDQEDMSNNILYAALGIGIAGTFGAASARYGIRQWANSPLVKNTRETALDPGMYSRMRQLIGSPSTQAGPNGPKLSSILTAQVLEANYKLDSGGASASLQRHRESLQTRAMEQAHQTLQKITTRGVVDLPNTKFSVDGTPEGIHLKETLAKDGGALYGADGLARVPEDKSIFDLIQMHQDRIKSLMASNDPADIRLGQALSRQEPLVLVNREWVDVQVGAEIAAYRPAQLKKAATTQEYDFTGQKGHTYRVDEFGRVFNLTGKAAKPIQTVANWESMPLGDQLDVFAAMRNTMDHRIKTGSAYVLPANPTWIQMDYALALAQRGGTVDTVQFAKLPTLHDVQLESLKKKGAILGQRKSISDLDRIRYNLPFSTSFERVVDPDGDSLKLLFKTAGQAGATADDLKAARTTGQYLFELSDGQTLSNDLSGDVFNFMRDRQGKLMHTVLGFFSDNEAPKWSKFSLAESIAETKAERFHALTGTGAGRLTRQLTTEIYASPLLNDAQRIAGLADNQVTGTSSRLGAAAGTILSQEMLARDNATVLAAQRLRHLVNQQSDHHMADAVKRHMGDVLNRLDAASAASTRHLTNQFLSNRGAWELKRAPVPVGNGMWGFELVEKSAMNRHLLGRAVQPGELLVNPATGKEIVLDNLGLEFQNRLNRLTDELLIEKNALRKANGLKPLNNRPWFTPPPNTKGKYIGFTFDADDQLVHGGAILAETAEEFKRLVKDLEANLPPGHRFRTREDIAAFADLWDRAAMDWIDPGAVMSPAVRSKGTIGSATINQRAVQETMDWIRSSYQSVTDSTVRTIFDGPLSVVRARRAVEESNVGKTTRTIFDHYEDALMGRRFGNSPKSPIGPVANALDTFMNAKLAVTWSAARGGYQHVRDLFNRLGFKGNPQGRDFQALVNELGPYTPYKNAEDYLKQIHKLTPPPEVDEIATNINRLSSAMLLRWLELPHAAMNMLGILTNMPSILQSRGVTTLPTIGRPGSRLRILDTYKIMAQGFTDMLGRKAHGDWQYMVRNGDTTQSVMELNQQLGLIESRGTFKRVMLGDPTSTGTGLKAGIKRKGIDGLISAATDTTEEWSRSWAHFVGLRLADAQGIVGREARHNYAREIANQTIANYNPLNRPELFHSSLGNMYGLFASYMLQYNMRLFRWMERGQYNALARQLSTQMTMFGLKSVPGFALIQHLAGGAIAGDPSKGETPIDGIYERFGPLAGTAVAHGGLTQLATIFGFDPADGPALFARGDANVRSPTVDMTQLMAGISVLKSIGIGIWEAAEMALNDNSIASMDRLTEILSRNLPNRMMKGALTVLANRGQDIDSSGQVIAETKSEFETMYRIIGLRSVRQQGEIDAYYLNNRAMDIDAARLAKVRVSTRALIRSGDMERLPEVFEKYLAAGGKPWNYPRWIRSQIDEAVDSRSQKQLLKAMRTPGQEALARRIELMSGVSPQ